MRSKKDRRTATLVTAVEPELRARIEREAERRDTSLSSTIRSLLRSSLQRPERDVLSEPRGAA